jgi:hypothetical protein
MLLGMECFAKPPSDSTFRLLLAQLDVEGFEAFLQQWMAAQPGVTDTDDTLVCDGKTLRGSNAEHASGAARYGLRPTASQSPRTPTPPMPAVRSAPCGSSWTARNWKVCWAAATLEP